MDETRYHTVPSRPVPSRRRDGKESSRDETVTVRCEISRFSRLLIIVNFLNIVKSLETYFNLFKNVFTRNYWGQDVFNRMLS